MRRFLQYILTLSVIHVSAETIDRCSPVSLSFGDIYKITDLTDSAAIKSVETGVEIREDEAGWKLVIDNYAGDSLSIGLQIIELNKGDFDHREVLRASVTLNDSTVYSNDLTKGVATHRGTNFLKASISSSGLTLSIGSRTLSQIFRLNGFNRIGSAKIVAGGKATIHRTVIVTIPAREKGRKHVAAPYTDINDGAVWKYIDHEIDPSYARRGGDYCLRSVRTDNGYDLVYISGATVCPENWTAGDIKGRLIESAVSGNYDLIWIGSELDSDFRDAHGVIENDIMTLTFPFDKARLRFVRQH